MPYDYQTAEMAEAVIAGGFDEIARYVRGWGWAFRPRGAQGPWRVDMTSHEDTAEAHVRTMLRRFLVDQALGAPSQARRNRLHGMAALDDLVRELRTTVNACASWPEDWDAVDTDVQTPEGVFDLVTGRLRPATDDDVNRLSLGVVPEDVPTPLFDRVFLEMNHGDPEAVEYHLKALGNTIIGGATDRQAYFVLGGTGTGKSLSFRLWRHLFGTYCVALDPRLAVRGAGAPLGENYETGWLPGARMVQLSEPSENGAVLDEAKFKSLTGGERIVGARMIYGAPLDFFPKFNLWMGANMLPRLQHGGPAILERVRIISMDAPPKVPDPSLLDKLKAEGPGIMHKILLHAHVRVTTGSALVAPPNVMRRSGEYAASVASIEPWCEERLEITDDPDDFLARADAYQDYVKWSHDMGMPPSVSQDSFGQRITNWLNRQTGGAYSKLNPSTRKRAGGGMRQRGHGYVKLKPGTTSLGRSAVPFDPLDF